MATKQCANEWCRRFIYEWKNFCNTEDCVHRCLCVCRCSCEDPDATILESGLCIGCDGGNHSVLPDRLVAERLAQHESVAKQLRGVLHKIEISENFLRVYHFEEVHMGNDGEMVAYRSGPDEFDDLEGPFKVENFGLGSPTRNALEYLKEEYLKLEPAIFCDGRG